MEALSSPTIQSLIGINIIMALGLYITISTGQFSLGHAAFAGIGAYAASVLTVSFHWPLVPAMLVATVFSGAFGALFALPALRTRGIYLAILSLGLGELVRVFLSSFEYTGGVAGFGGMRGTTPGLVLITLLVSLGLVRLLMRSPLGQAFQVVGEDEKVAGTLGLNATRLKVLAFGLGAAVTALGGALYAHLMFFIEPAVFEYGHSVLLLIFVVFGGYETMWGAVLGAVALTLLPEYVRGLEQWRMVMYGLILVFMMAVRPQGLLTRRLVSGIKGKLFRGRGHDVEPAGSNKTVRRVGGH